MFVYRGTETVTATRHKRHVGFLLTLHTLVVPFSFELKEMYDAQNLCYETLSSLEERISEAEHLYNEQFGAYVKARGLENIEVSFLEYVSDNIKVNMETGEVEYIIPPEEEKDE